VAEKRVHTKKTIKEKIAGVEQGRENGGVGSSGHKSEEPETEGRTLDKVP